MHDFHYWFSDPGFKFQDSVCNGCHDLEMVGFNINDIVKNVNYRPIIQNISKSDLLENSSLEVPGYI